jgi:ATP-dependent protease ClpP protease subunit
MAKKLVYAGEVGSELVQKVLRGGWTELILCSDGGCIYCARAICDYLLATEKKVLVTGQCMSAATAIAACGNPCIATTSTRFMVHPGGAEGATGGEKEMRNHAEELKVWNDWYIELLARRTKEGEEVWRDLFREESCFGARIALELGLIDGIR